MTIYEGKLIIGGQMCESQVKFEVYDKYTGELVAWSPVATHEQIDQAVAAAGQALAAISALSMEARLQVVERWADLIAAERDWFVDRMVMELGRARMVAEKFFNGALELIRNYRPYLKGTYGNLEHVLGPKETFFPGKRGYFWWEPKGVATVIVAGNAPLYLMAEKTVPLFLTGNSIMIKAPSQAPSMNFRAGELLLQAGIPPGSLSVIAGPGREVNRILTTHPQMDFIQFVGRAVHGPDLEKLAVEKYKEFIGEYEGNDWALIRADADLHKAASHIASGFTDNSGQLCMHIQGLLVHRSVYDEFIAILAQEVKSLVVGDPRNPGTQVGPLVNKDMVAIVMDQVAEALQQGAILVAGGRSEGNCVYPTIVAGINPDMRLVQEETFGPVVWVQPVADDAEGLQWLARNKHRLSATLFTRDVAAAEYLARKVRFSRVVINDNPTQTMHPFLPWGGAGISGKGGMIPYVEQYTMKKYVEIGL